MTTHPTSKSPTLAPEAEAASRATAQSTVVRPLDPMGGMMGSRYGSRLPPRPFIPRQTMPAPPAPVEPPPAKTSAPPPETSSRPALAAPPQSKRKPEKPRPGHKTNASLNPLTVRGKVALVVGLLTHRHRTKGGKRNSAPTTAGDLPSLHREDVAVECWRIYGHSFAMQRHDYPNLNASLAKMAELVQSGMLAQRAVGEVSLTPKGWWWWRRTVREYGGEAVPGKLEPEESGLFERDDAQVDDAASPESAEATAARV